MNFLLCSCFSSVLVLQKARLVQVVGNAFLMGISPGTTPLSLLSLHKHYRKKRRLDGNTEENWDLGITAVRRN